MAAKRKKTTKKAAKKGKRKAPRKKEEKGPDRDEKGRLLPGHSIKSPGRPKRIDVGSAIHRIAAEKGIDLEQAAWDLMESQRKLGHKDTQAAKLWLDRVGGLQRQHHAVKAETTVTNVTEEAREDLRQMAKGDDVQENLLDEMR